MFFHTFENMAHYKSVQLTVVQPSASRFLFHFKWHYGVNFAFFKQFMAQKFSFTERNKKHEL